MDENQERVIKDLKEIFGITGETPMPLNQEPVKKVFSQEYKPSYMELTKQQYERAYDQWSEEEDQLLIEMYNLGKSDSEIAEKLKRKPTAISARREKLLGK